MEGIPSIYWMILIGIFTGFVCFVLYQLGMLFKDSREVVKRAEKTVKLANDLVEEVSEIVDTVKGTIYQINTAVLVPLKKITTVLGIVSGIAEGISSKRSK